MSRETIVQKKWKIAFERNGFMVAYTFWLDREVDPTDYARGYLNIPKGTGTLLTSEKELRDIHYLTINKSEFTEVDTTKVEAVPLASTSDPLYKPNAEDEEEYLEEADDFDQSFVKPLIVLCGPGQKILVRLNETDGEFTVFYDTKRGRLTVEADLPDTTGRTGVIYEELFGPLAPSLGGVRLPKYEATVAADEEKCDNCQRPRRVCDSDDQC